MERRGDRDSVSGAGHPSIHACRSQLGVLSHAASHTPVVERQESGSSLCRTSKCTRLIRTAVRSSCCGVPWEKFSTASYGSAMMTSGSRSLQRLTTSEALSPEHFSYSILPFKEAVRYEQNKISRFHADSDRLCLLHIWQDSQGKSLRIQELERPAVGRVHKKRSVAGRE